MLWRQTKRFLFLTLLAFLVACAGNDTYVPVKVEPQTSVKRYGYHQVNRGETLFSIAFAYGVDYKALASTNKIRAPYVIYPGQKLRFGKLLKGAQSPAKKAKKIPPRVAAKPTPSPTKTKVPKPSVKKLPPKASKKAPKLTWLWPARGAIVGRFRPTGKINKGIDISGKLGDSVVSAQAGKVVYAGTSLVGYGKLIIIKHNESFLSAYAHNRRLLVKEGQFVKAGTKIAEVGSSGTDRTKLHFEIRHNGKPVDPLKYLPKR